MSRTAQGLSGGPQAQLLASRPSSTIGNGNQAVPMEHDAFLPSKVYVSMLA